MPRETVYYKVRLKDVLVFYQCWLGKSFSYSTRKESDIALLISSIFFIIHLRDWQMASETLSGAFYWLSGHLQKSIYFYIWSSLILLWRRVNLLKTNKYKNVIFFLKIQNWSDGVMVYHLRQERIQCKLELIVIIWSYILNLKRYFR